MNQSVASASARYSAVRLDGLAAHRVAALHAAGEPVQLRVLMEVLEVNSAGRALVWVHDDRRQHGARLGRCKLTPAQIAEVLMCQRQNLRVAFEVSFEVLGPLHDGRWGIASHDSQIKLVQLGLIAEDDELSRLLGAAEMAA